MVKCRPPGNRDPLPGGDRRPAPRIWNARSQAIQPRVIVTLGRFSMARFFPNARISDIHGQARMVNGRLVVAMYHPAAALHQPSLRREIEADFARLPALIQRAAPAGAGEAGGEPSRLNSSTCSRPEGRERTRDDVGHGFACRPLPRN